MSTQAKEPTKKERILQLLEGMAATGEIDANDLAEKVGANPENVRRTIKEWRDGKAEVSVEMISIDRIEHADDLQMRPDLDKATVVKYAERYEDGSEAPPIDVFRTPDHKFALAHGYHRVYAAKTAGRTTIAARVHQGDRRSATLFAAAANKDNGLPRCKETEKKAAFTLFADEEWAAKADAEIALYLGISRQQTNRLRIQYNALNGNDKRRRPDIAQRQNKAESNGTYEDDVDGRKDHAQLSIESTDVQNEEPAPKETAADRIRQRHEDFLESLPLRKRLKGTPLEVFEVDALYYLKMADVKAMLSHQHDACKTTDAKAKGRPLGLYQHKVEQFLRLDHPRDWKVCLKCDGKGCGGCNQRGHVN